MVSKQVRTENGNARTPHAVMGSGSSFAYQIGGFSVRSPVGTSLAGTPVACALLPHNPPAICIVLQQTFDKVLGDSGEVASIVSHRRHRSCVCTSVIYIL